MLESLGPVGYVIGKLSEMRENVASSQAYFEAIEIIEALILALVAVAIAWSWYQAAQWAGKRAEQYAQAYSPHLTDYCHCDLRAASAWPRLAAFAASAENSIYRPKVPLQGQTTSMSLSACYGARERSKYQH